MNQDIVLSVALPVTLFCIMFSMGTALVLQDFTRIARQPGSVLVGVMSQMVFLPLLALGVMIPLNLPAEILVGFIILALSPGGTTSNLFSYMAGGNVALSISLTAVVSLVTPLSIPLLGGWLLSTQLAASHAIHLPFLETVAKLVVITVIPVTLGMLLRHYRSGFCTRHKTWLARVPFGMLMLVICGIIFRNWTNMPSYISQTGLPALLLATLALLGGFFLARFMQQDFINARTIAIETSIQNGGTAILITGTILKNPAMTIAPVMYGILMLIPVFVYLLWFHRLKPLFSS